MRSLRLRPLAGLLLVAACVAPPAPIYNAGISTVSTQRDWSFLTLGPSDVLRVTVQNHPELSSAPDGVRVDPQGAIHLPEIGRIPVQGRSLEELNTLLNTRLQDILLQPHVTVTLLDYASRSYYLLGHLEEPGVKLMDRPVTALEAVAQGGQFLRGADRRTLFLLRPHEDRLEVHRFSLRPPGPAGLVQVQPGDVIFVRPTGSWDFQEKLLPILAGLGLSANTLVYASLID